MKSCCLIIFCFFLSHFGYGQYFRGSAFPHSIQSSSSRPQDKAGSIVINYCDSDQLLFSAPDFIPGLWNMNMNYAPLSNDSSVIYGIVAFDSIISFDNQYSYAYSQIGLPTLDSIWIHFGHENNSGTTDTLVVDVIELDTLNHPTLTVLWSDTLLFNVGQSPSNQWQNTAYLTLAPQLLLKLDTAIGIRFRYYGALADTFGIVAGYGTNHNSCGSFDWPVALKSHFYPNSYAYWNPWQLQLPTHVGGDIYYDCNNNFEYDPNDGENYIQNWDVAVQISSNDIGFPGIIESEFQIYPNPSSGTVYFKGKNNFLQNITIRTIEGRILFSKQNISELDISGLNQGIYIIEIYHDQKYFAQKLIVCH